MLVIVIRTFFTKLAKLIPPPPMPFDPRPCKRNNGTAKEMHGFVKGLKILGWSTFGHSKWTLANQNNNP